HLPRAVAGERYRPPNSWRLSIRSRHKTPHQTAFSRSPSNHLFQYSARSFSYPSIRITDPWAIANSSIALLRSTLSMHTVGSSAGSQARGPSALEDPPLSTIPPNRDSSITVVERECRRSIYGYTGLG